MSFRRFLAVPLLSLPLIVAGWAAAGGAADGGGAAQRLSALYSNGGGHEAARPAEPALKLSQSRARKKRLEKAKTLHKRGQKLRNQGKYAKAVPLFRKSLEIREDVLGSNHPATAKSLNALAQLYITMGRYDEVEALHKKALEARIEEFGEHHRAVGQTLNNLATLYRIQGRYDEAEPMLTRALAIQEKALGADHPGLAKALVDFAQLYRAQGRFDEAEPLLKRALAIQEKALGLDHPGVAKSLNNLALLYRLQGRYAEAEPLVKRGVAIIEKELGAEHPGYAKSLRNLASLYRSQGRESEAEPLLERGLAIAERTLGPDHPDVAKFLRGLAALYAKRDGGAGAEPLLRRALAINEKALGDNHPVVADVLQGLADLHTRQEKFSDAEPLLKRALAINADVLGPDHPALAKVYKSLAVVRAKQRRPAEALSDIRRATAIHRNRAKRSGGQRSVGGTAEQKKVRGVFLWHVRHLQRLMSKAEGKPKRQAKLLAEAFEIGQLARATGAAAAVAGMASRFAAGDDALGRTVRDHQDSVERWRILDARLVKATSAPPEKRDSKAEDELRVVLAALDRQIDELGARLATEFPEYAELAKPQPLSVAEAQRLLAPGEALMTYAAWNDVTFLWVVRRDRAAFHRLEIGREELDKAVRRLRRGLDQLGVVRSIRDIRPFAVKQAHVLYEKLFAPAEPLLKGARHVFVVPDAGLQSLPLAVLATEAPAGRIKGMSDYLDVKWLARKYAMTVLPSVGSLAALRRFPKKTRATRPFLGFGDPALEGDPGSARGANVATLLGRGVDAAAILARGGVAGSDTLQRLRSLPRLPDTAGELAAMARALGSGDDSIFLREQATERRVRTSNLADARVLAFATHGLLAGEIKGVGEPALVMSPPEKGTAEDDGLLTASEIAGLDLNADWVILSACNTAGADGKPGAEGLSGLAKAFFYAGARALLVSHWSVVSDAAVGLTTEMLREVTERPGTGRAEALRLAMLKLMANSEKPYYAHPMFWAPFIVVGEGGTPKAS